MAIYCGVDFHPRQQSVSYCDAADGEIRYRELHHERDDLHSFYSQFTGEVIVGNIGSAQRLDYTLVGDVVNTASRLSSLAAADQIMVSHLLIEVLPPDWRPPWELVPLERVGLKGKQEPHQIYEIAYRGQPERSV